MEFPIDRRLPGLPGLFDGGWVWQTFCREYGEQELEPESIEIRGFSHTQGRAAVVNYEIEWPPDAYVPNEWFTIHLERGEPLRVSRFPDDPRLPGLREASSPESALRLVSKYVAALPPRRIRVQLIRYRSGSHAVLRHQMSGLRLYVRVVRPSTIPDFLKSAELIGMSDFAVPRVVGLWQDGGVLWFSEIPGKNLHRLLRKDEQPAPGLLLDGLESLWALPAERADVPPFNLPGAYRRTKQILGHALLQNNRGRGEYNNAVEALDPFVKNWRPSGIAHNDFYDDQLVMLPDDRIALVDIEGAGPGDPMLDVGNFLAHLKWSSQVSRRGPSFAKYHDKFRSEALARLGWEESDLDLREAVCLFRICTNAVRHPREDWREKLAVGLSLVSETLP